MKFVTLLLLIILTGRLESQQTVSGKIIYKETIKLNIDVGADRPEMAKMFPTSQSVDKVLYFNANESLFKNNEQPKDLDVKHEEEGSNFQIVMKMPESTIYINKSENVYLHSQDLM